MLPLYISSRQFLQTGQWTLCSQLPLVASSNTVAACLTVSAVHTYPYPVPRFPGLVRKFFGSRTFGCLVLPIGLKAAGDGLMHGQKLPFPQLPLYINIILAVY